MVIMYGVKVAHDYSYARPTYHTRNRTASILLYIAAECSNISLRMGY